MFIMKIRRKQIYSMGKESISPMCGGASTLNGIVMTNHLNFGPSGIQHFFTWEISCESGRGEGINTDVWVARKFSSWMWSPSELQQYDEDLIRHANLWRKPATIAELLQKEYNLDPNFMTPEKVNRRLRYLKQNKLTKLPPTNSEISLLATNTSKPTCK